MRHGPILDEFFLARAAAGQNLRSRRAMQIYYKYYIRSINYCLYSTKIESFFCARNRVASFALHGNTYGWGLYDTGSVTKTMGMQHNDRGDAKVV